jgi:rubrerythrin
MDPRTRENLLAAMHGEAFAYLKYMLFAEQARKGGNFELAKLFEETANIERFEHFAEEAELLGLVGTDEANLRDAIEGESYEVDTMYREFAEQAATAGDQAAAERFAEVREDEMGHRDAYKGALARISLTPVGAGTSEGHHDCCWRRPLKWRTRSLPVKG